MAAQRQRVKRSSLSSAALYRISRQLKAVKILMANNDVDNGRVVRQCIGKAAHRSIIAAAYIEIRSRLAPGGIKRRR